MAIPRLAHLVQRPSASLIGHSPEVFPDNLAQAIDYGRREVTASKDRWKQLVEFSS